MTFRWMRSRFSTPVDPIDGTVVHRTGDAPVSAVDHVRALARLVARGVRARGGPVEVPTGPRRRLAVEKAALVVDPRAVARYLAATNGAGIEAFRGPHAVAPPLFPGTWGATAALELLALIEPPLPLGAVVHLEEEVLPIRPLRVGERVRFRLELDRAERVRKGVRMTLVARCWNAAGVLCTESSSVLLVKTPAPRSAGGAAEGGDAIGSAPSPPPAELDEIARWSLGGGEGRRYARVSGDYNPIHLWGLTARAFGFRRPILHGLATGARVAHALVERRFGGDPAALRRLRIIFRAPLPLPSRVRLLAGETRGHGAFRVVSDDGATVFAEGRYNGTEAPPDAR
jgi:acyl dehydratase